MSPSEDGGSSDLDLGPFWKRNARRELIFRDEEGRNPGSWAPNLKIRPPRSINRSEIYGGNQSLPFFQPQFSGRSRGRDFRRGRDRRRNRWVARAEVVAKKSAVEVFSALKNPQLAKRKRERCISGRTVHEKPP